MSYFDEEWRRREALYDITDIDVDEVSVVNRGDNPGARIVVIKNEPTPLLSDEEIAEVISETEAEFAKDAAPPTVQAMRLLAEREARRDPSLTPSEAYSKALSSPEGAEVRALARQAADQSELSVPAETQTQREARGQVLHLVNQIQRERPGMSPADAWSEAHRRDPGLYAKAKGGS